MVKPALNMDKLKNLIHYICYKADSKNLGKTKLNKVLWFSDAMFYLYNSHPITGETYVKGRHGPVSKNIDAALRKLAKEKKVLESNAYYYGYPKKDYAVLENPDISGFTAEEISLVDDTIKRVCDDSTAEEISKHTHNEIWKVAEMGEELPYSAVAFGKAVELTSEDIEWAQNVIDERAHELAEV